MTKIIVLKGSEKFQRGVIYINYYLVLSNCFMSAHQILLFLKSENSGFNFQCSIFRVSYYSY